MEWKSLQFTNPKIEHWTLSVEHLFAVCYCYFVSFERMNFSSFYSSSSLSFRSHSEGGNVLRYSDSFFLFHERDIVKMQIKKEEKTTHNWKELRFWFEMKSKAHMCATHVSMCNTILCLPASFHFFPLAPNMSPFSLQK